MEEHNQELQDQVVEETTQEQEQPQAQSAPVETEGMKELRAQRERLAKENRELMMRLKQVEDAKKAIADDGDPDDLVPRRYVDERLKAVERQVMQTSTEYKIKNNYPDFDKVVNDATIERLKEKNPALAYAIGQVGDIYSQASAAYEAIKNLGIYVEDNYARDREKAQENAAKPRTLQSIASNSQKSHSPLSGVNAFAEGSKEYKEQLWKEMNYYRKQQQ